MNIKTCDKRGKIDDAPSKEEFCFAYRAQKLADQYKCPLMMYLKEYLKGNDVDMTTRGIVKENMNILNMMGGKKGHCGKNKRGMVGRDVPIIWRKHMGNIVKGTFCELDGEWYWQKVATCGCKQCEMGGMLDDFIMPEN